MCQTVHSGGPFIVRQLHDMYIIRDQIGQETRTPVSSDVRVNTSMPDVRMEY